MNGRRVGSLAVCLVVIGFIGFLASACTLPAFQEEGGETNENGERDILVFSGHIALLLGWLHPAWLANPIAFVGLLLLVAKRPAGTALCAAVSLSMGIGFLSLLYLLGGPPNGPLAGGYVWLAGFAWLLGGALATRRLGWGQGPTDVAPEVIGMPVWLLLLTMIGALVLLLLLAAALFKW